MSRIQGGAPWFETEQPDETIQEYVERQLDKVKRSEWKRYTPNAITCLRIILSAFLLLINPDNISFLLIYGTCGLTDVVDVLVIMVDSNTLK